MKAQYKPIFPLTSNSFKAEHQVKDKINSPGHYHSEFELTLILSSNGVRYVGNHFEDFGNSKNSRNVHHISFANNIN